QRRQLASPCFGSALTVVNDIRYPFVWRLESEQAPRIMNDFAPSDIGVRLTEETAMGYDDMGLRSRVLASEVSLKDCWGDDHADIRHIATCRACRKAVRSLGDLTSIAQPAG